jgi:hypothetical protein
MTLVTFPITTQAKANAVLVFAAVACLLDGFTTWVAVNAGYQEESAGTAALIHQLGLATGLAISILSRIAIFEALAVAIERFTRGRLALFAIALVAAGITWLIVLGNIATLANGHA